MSPYSRDRGEIRPCEVLAGGARWMMIDVEAGAGALVLFRTVPKAIAKHVGILTGAARFIHTCERLGGSRSR
jgi:cell wall-associated NlpC family hydrolase